MPDLTARHEEAVRADEKGPAMLSQSRPLARERGSALVSQTQDAASVTRVVEIIEETRPRPGR